MGLGRLKQRRTKEPFTKQPEKEKKITNENKSILHILQKLRRKVDFTHRKCCKHFKDIKRKGTHKLLSQKKKICLKRYYLASVALHFGTNFIMSVFACTGSIKD